MALTNHERVGKALELLRGGLRPFVRSGKSNHIRTSESPGITGEGR